MLDEQDKFEITNQSVITKLYWLDFFVRDEPYNHTQSSNENTTIIISYIINCIIYTKQINNHQPFKTYYFLPLPAIAFTTTNFHNWRIWGIISDLGFLGLFGFIRQCNSRYWELSLGIVGIFFNLKMWGSFINRF